MAAHLPLPVRPDDENIWFIDFAPAIQYCVRRSRRFQIIAHLFKIVSALGGVIILFLLGFWSADPNLQWRNVNILYASKSLALLVSISSSLNYVFDFQRKANKYDSARRVLADLEAKYSVLGKDTPGSLAVVNKYKPWARESISQIERLLDNDKVYDVEMHFKMSPLPS